MNKKIIIKINGGLGNQLFQLANVYELSIKYNRQLLICNDNSARRNTYWGNILHQFKDNLIDNNEYNLLKSQATLWNWAMTRFEYKEIILDEKKEIYCIEGYYQSYKYFNVDNFKTKINFDNLIKNYINDTNIFNEDVICLHIRRGDYLNNNFHKVLSIDYYYNAINAIKKNNIINKIFIFSDDIPWCNTYFKGDKYIFVKENEIKEILMMSQFKHIIIANSSFSWWAAYFNNKNNVYCPKHWFTSNCHLNTVDLRPPQWNIIDDNLKLNEEIYTFDPSKKNIISLGSACCMVQNIHDNIYNSLGPIYRQPDNASNFFNWVIVDFKSILYIFENLVFKDDSFLNQNNFTLKNIISSPEKMSGGWKSVYRKVESKFEKMIFLHDVKKELDEIPDDFYDKYKRRFHRLYNKFIEHESIHFMHCFDFQWLSPYFPSENEILLFFSYCRQINPIINVQIYFFIHPKYNTPEYKNHFEIYKNIDNLHLCFLNDKGFKTDWKADNLTWDSFLKIN